MRIAPQMHVRLVAEMRDDPTDVDHQQREGAERRRPTGEPAARAQGQPRAETHDRQRCVFPASEGEEGGAHEEPRAPDFREVDRRQQQRDGERRGVEVAHVDAVERWIDQVEDGEGGRGALVLEPVPRDAEDRKRPSARMTDWPTRSTAALGISQDGGTKRYTIGER